MDTIEATKMVMSRIQKIDPENASKIMGYILIQDQGENEMIRLAFGPENLLASVIKQAKTFLDISSNTSSASHQRSPRIIIPNNGGYHHHLNPASLSPHSPWSSSSGSFPHNSPRAASYASVVNGGGYNSFNDVTDDPIVSPGGRSDSILFDYGDAQQHLHHRRSCSVNDMFVGVGGNDCMYYGQGFCKNGPSCRFGHGDEMSSPPAAANFGSPNGNGIEDFLRIKAIQQQQHRAMAAGGHHHHHPFHFNRSPSAAAAAATMMMGEDFHKFGRMRPDRHDLVAMSSSSRQIYLTFPADSTFKEEDVSNYFSMFGPVHDVRIPYQQKRMFGFVTFVLPETVKAILAKGNPHFVCDSRVLVKPYKEKGKIPDKKHLQQIERGDFSALESAEPFDHIPFGARMFNHEMMLRRKLEGRAELQQAIDFQERKLMNMQITELNSHNLSHPQTNENVVSGEINGSGDGSEAKVPHEVNDVDDDNKEESPDVNETCNHESSNFEHILPDNLFASPTKTAATDHQSIFSTNDIPEAEADAADHGASSNISHVLPHQFNHH